MNQGMTRLRREFGDKQAKKILRLRAGILRQRLSSEYSMRFNKNPIDLKSLGHSSRLSFYEFGHAFGIKYERESLPSKEELIKDLSEMLKLYRIAKVRGGTSESIFERLESSESHPDLSKLSLEEKRRYIVHRSIDWNPKLAKAAKQIHGYTCQVCRFNFEREYGELGLNYIEAHHLTPLSKILPEAVKLSPKNDFAVVCANCHKMIHRKGASATFKEFVRLYQNRKRQIHLNALKCI